MNEFSVTIVPRFYETDALGHINNAAIAAWFEVARVRFLESLGESEPSSAKDWMLASMQIDFAAETFYGKDVEAKITGAEVGNSSLTVDCEMYQDGGVTVRCNAVLVHMDTDEKKPARIPDSLRDKVAEFSL
jgi:acyl-CoA thioester hydrolase